jgi:hypothetical protein
LGGPDVAQFILPYISLFVDVAPPKPKPVEVASSSSGLQGADSLHAAPKALHATAQLSASALAPGPLGQNSLHQRLFSPPLQTLPQSHQVPIAHNFQPRYISLSSPIPSVQYPQVQMTQSQRGSAAMQPGYLPSSSSVRSHQAAFPAEPGLTGAMFAASPHLLSQHRAKNEMGNPQLQPPQYWGISEPSYSQTQSLHILGRSESKRPNQLTGSNLFGGTSLISQSQVPREANVSFSVQASSGGDHAGRHSHSQRLSEQPSFRILTPVSAASFDSFETVHSQQFMGLQEARPQARPQARLHNLEQQLQEHEIFGSSSEPLCRCLDFEPGSEAHICTSFFRDSVNANAVANSSGGSSRDTISCLSEVSLEGNLLRGNFTVS